MYILADMADNADMVYSAQDIKDGFIEGANESKKRIDEQLSVGNIEMENDGYRISEKGEKLIQLLCFVETIFPVLDESSIYPASIGG